MSLNPFSMTVDWMNGSQDGCVRVVVNPHATVYRIPRDFTQELSSEEELKQAGIYILTNTNEKTVYVGQADSRDNGHGLLNRMIEKHSNSNAIDNWNLGYALTNESPHFFGATELNYLERLFYDFALGSGKYKVLNGNRPHATDPGYSIKTRLKNYVEIVFVLLSSQGGCDVFDMTNIFNDLKNYESKTIKSKTRKSVDLQPTEIKPSIQPDESKQVSSRIGIELFLNGPVVGAYAKGEMFDEKKIVVKAGSRISESNNLSKQSGHISVNKERLELERVGIIRNRVFTKDHIFTSPSQAASLILGTSASGNDKWKTAGGIKLGDLREGVAIAQKNNAIQSSQHEIEEKTSSDISNFSLYDSNAKDEDITLFEFCKTVEDPSITQEKGKDSPDASISVLFPDGTIVQREKAVDTFVDTIERIGPERIAELAIYNKGTRLVSRVKNTKYTSRQLKNGLFVITHSSTEVKIRYLKQISELLNLGLRVAKV